MSQILTRFIRESPISLTLSSPGFDDAPLVMVNEAFEDLTGYGADFSVGRNCRFLQGPRTEDLARRKLHDAIADRREVIVPITNYRRDGSQFRNLVFVFPIFDSTGRLLYMMGSQYDVSAPVRAVSPREYGQILEETITVSNPSLSDNDNLRIATQARLAEVVAKVLERTP